MTHSSLVAHLWQIYSEQQLANVSPRGLGVAKSVFYSGAAGIVSLLAHATASGNDALVMEMTRQLRVELDETFDEAETKSKPQ